MSLLALALALPAHATRSFDPARPEAVFDGQECYTQDGGIRLWSRVERFSDPDRGLFAVEAYNDVTAWPAESSFAPWIADMFGTATPHSSAFLLHAGPNLDFTAGTPILMVPGAGDNASRGFVTMAARMDLRGRPVYAMTFAHPHGDVFRHAEAIADAIARVKADTGAAQVDVVAHSKGGVELALYLANTAEAEWGDTPSAAAYEAVGTAYRGDVRKAVFVATPLGGIDTAYRWTNANLLGLDADTALAPTSWSAYYPYGTATWTVRDDLAAQDFLPGDGDLFPGQRQLLARQEPELPGATPALGAYAVQLDWYTTYEGGTGFYSTSDGIDAAIEAGGDLLGTLARNGADPGVRLYVLAGSNPLMPNGTGDFVAQVFGEGVAEMGEATTSAWGNLLAELVGDGLIEQGVAREEVQGLVSGALVLGDVSGPSDGLVFVGSATDAGALTARGARVVESAVKNLSHIDLLYASPITGQMLLDASDDSAANTWMAAVGRRYVEEDSLGWVEAALAEDEGTGGDDTATDTGANDTASGDTGAPGDDPMQDVGEEGGAWGGCEGCAGTGASPVGAFGWVVAALGVLARRRRT